MVFVYTKHLNTRVPQGNAQLSRAKIFPNDFYFEKVTTTGFWKKKHIFSFKKHGCVVSTQNSIGKV